MRKFLACIAVVALVAGCPAAHAVQPDEIMSDPVKEARARDLSRELRCMVCQNQSIDDSEAPLAKDLRVLVRERLTQGDSDRQVLDFLVSRYGEFVLLKPPFELHTLLLWGVSPVVLLIGIFALLMMARRRTTVTAPPPALSEAERQRLSTLVSPPAADR